MKQKIFSLIIFLACGVVAHAQNGWHLNFIESPQFEGKAVPAQYYGKTPFELTASADDRFHVTGLDSVNPLDYSWVTYNGGTGEYDWTPPADPSPELRPHAVLDEFVEEMNSDPLALAAYAQDEIELIDIITTNVSGDAVVENLGMNRGALGVFMEEQGSPAEQCALLVYLLRRAGYPAAYVSPTDADGTKDVWMLMRHYNRMTGFQFTDSTPSDDVRFATKYPWVIMYTDKSGSGGEWVHFFPWIKDTMLEEGFDLYETDGGGTPKYMPTAYEDAKTWLEKYFQNDSIIESFIRSDGRDNPGILFPRHVSQSLSDKALSLDDIGVKRYNRKHSYSDWDDFPKPFAVGNPSDAGVSLTISPWANDRKDHTDVFNTMTVTLLEDGVQVFQSAPLRMADLHNRRLYSFVDSGSLTLRLAAYDPDLAPALTTGDFSSTEIPAAQEISVAYDSNATYQIELDITRYPSGANPYDVTVDTVLYKGAISALCLNTGRVTSKMLNVHAEAFWKKQNEGGSPEYYDFISHLVYLVGMAYYESVDQADSTLRNIHKIMKFNSLAFGVSSVAPDGSGNLRYPAIDMSYFEEAIGNSSINPYSPELVEETRRNFNFMWMANISASEHQILNTFYQQSKSVSTARLLRYANERHSPSEGNNGDGYFTFSRSEFYNATNPGNATYATLRTDAGSQWSDAYEAIGFELDGNGDPIWTGDISADTRSDYPVSDYETVYITPFPIENDTSSPNFEGMGTFAVGVDRYRALIGNNLNGGWAQETIVYDVPPNTRLTVSTTVGYTVTTEPTPSSTQYVSQTVSVQTVPEHISHFDVSSYTYTSAQYNQYTSWGNSGLFSETPSYDLGDVPSGSSTYGDVITASQNSGYQAEKPWYAKAGDFVADPVDVITGSFYEDHVDLSLPSRIPLNIRRNYSSQNKAASIFGYGWKPEWLPYLVVLGYDDSVSNPSTYYGHLIHASDPNGSTVAYRETSPGSGLWKPQVADNPNLSNYDGGPIRAANNPMLAYIEKSTDGADTIYTLYRPNGAKSIYTVKSFPLSAEVTRERPYLTRVEDNVGNGFDFEFYGDGASPGDPETKEAEYGQLHRIVADNGNFVVFKYNIYGFVTDAFMKDGRRVRYNYDNFGNLVYVKTPDGAEIEYEYDIRDDDGAGPEPAYSTHLITKVIKPDGRVLKNVYDPLYDPSDTTYRDSKYRRIVEQYATVGSDDLTLVHQATFEYDPPSDPWVVAGYQVTKLHDQTRPSKGVFITTYVHQDGLKHYVAQPLAPASFTANDDYVTAFEWYGEGEANGYNRSVKSIKNDRGLETHYTYETNTGNIATVKLRGDLDGDSSNGDADESLTRYFYDTSNERNVLVKTIQPAREAGAPNRVVYVEYPTDVPAGTLSFESPPGVWHYRWLPLREAVHVVDSPSLDTTEPSSVTKVAETIYTHGMETDSIITAHGLEKKVATQTSNDPDDKTETTRTFDARGYRVSETRKTFTSDADVTTTYSYNDRGMLTMEIDAAGRVTEYAYDAMGRLIWEERFESLADFYPSWWTDYYYTLNGEVEWIDGPQYGVEDYVFREYDGAGRVSAQAEWLSQTNATKDGIESSPDQNFFLGQAFTFYDYDAFGNLVQKTDAKGHYTVMDYDALGRLKTLESYDDTDLLLATESFEYEPGGEVTLHTNPNGGDTTTSYTDTGAVKTIDYPDDTSESYTYYLDGMVKSKTLPNNSVWTYTYDDALRSTTKELTQSGTTLAKEETFTDSRGNTTANFVWEDNDTVHLYGKNYDGLNRVIESTGPADFELDGITVSERQKSTWTYAFDGVIGTSTVTQTTGTSSGKQRVTVTTRDGLKRVSQIDVNDGSSNLVERTTKEYASDHTWAQVTKGTNTDVDLKVKTYTNTRGKPVLKLTSVNTGASVAEVMAYDENGNLKSETDKLNRLTQYTYDGLNRLKTKTLPDNAVTTFDYDDAGNMTLRDMPGDTAWSAQYDSANRKQWEKLTANAQEQRRMDYTYHVSGDGVGILKTVTEKRGTATLDDVVTTYAYDPSRRVASISTSSASSDCVDTILAFEYDFRGLRTSAVRSVSPSDSLIPDTQVVRAYDGYGQVVKEEILTGAYSGGVFMPDQRHNRFYQAWDEVGKRISLSEYEPGIFPTYEFTYTAGRFLDTTSLGTITVNHDFADNGLLTDRDIRLDDALENVIDLNIPSDGRNRAAWLLKRNQTHNSSALVTEDFTRYLDSRVNQYLMTRTDGTASTWDTAQKLFTCQYNNRGQMTEEDIQGQVYSKTLTFDFDGDKLGVRTSAKEDSVAFWESTALDDFQRVTEESDTGSVDGRSVVIRGQAPHAKKVEFFLNQTGFPFIGEVKPNAGDPDGNWEFRWPTTAGAKSVYVQALHEHPDGNTALLLRNFTVNASALGNHYTNTFDNAGYTVSRTWKGGQVEQSLTWDGQGNLVKATLTDNRATPRLRDYTWTANYDALGRRLSTHFHYDAQAASSAQVIKSFYDPEVEFLEIGIEHRNKRHWKLYGSDLSETYGGVQGVGGLAAFIDESTRQPVVVANDAFGNALFYIATQGTISSGDDTMGFNFVEHNGYGFLPEFHVDDYETFGGFARSHSWQGRRIDPTGFFYFGARYYDSANGRFISPDPLGHSASMDLYSYANGDPLNVIDADGRIGKGVVKGVVQGDFANYDNPAQQISGLVGQIATGFTPAGVLADIRDFGASVSDMATGDGSWKGLAIATAGLIPGVSEVRKGANVVEAVNDLRRVETATTRVYEDISTQAVNNADEYVDVYRAFGGDSRAQGFSWTRADPRTVDDFRNVAGLPSGGASGATNTAEFLIKGRVHADDVIKFKTADPLDGNIGGLDELIINPDSVNLTDFWVIQP